MVTILRKLRKNHKGVSLIEIIVAMLVLAISVVSLLAMFLRSMSTNAKSRRAMSATVIAQNFMEAAKEYARNNTVVDDGTGSWLLGLLPGYSYDSSTGYYIATEGYYTYAVRVYYSNDKYESKNNTKIPDITALGQSETVQICPSQVRNGQFEQSAREYFDLCLENAYLYAHKDDEDDSYIEDKDINLASVTKDVKSEVKLEVTKSIFDTYDIKAKLVYTCDYRIGDDEVVWIEDYSVAPYEAYEFRENNFDPGVDKNNVPKKLKVFLFLDPCNITDGAGTYSINDKVEALAMNCDYELYIANQVCEECFQTSSEVDFETFDLKKLSGPGISGSTGNIQFFATNELKGVEAKKDSKGNNVIYNDGKVTPLQDVTVEVLYYEDGEYKQISSLESAVFQ